MNQDEKCDICGGSGKRTDPIDGTVWDDEPCLACQSSVGGDGEEQAS